ncbi:MAG: AAC(3) family N-acetyltransferase [Lishizhenia sp.]
MSSIKDVIRRLTPNFLLDSFRKIKKKKRNRTLKYEEAAGGISEDDLIKNFKNLGIEEGDSVLVHSALSKVGFIAGGPITFIQALISCVGKEGNILMPTSPNDRLQLEYIQNLEVFDVRESKSNLGKITEVFRSLPETKRSLHPTEPVSVFGPNADWFTTSHHLSETPYGQNSPWFKLTEKKGKILYVGCTLSNAGTSLHCLEDAVADFKFPVYYQDKFKVSVRNYKSELITVETKVHNPEYSKKRKCDDLIPMFEREGVAKRVKVGDAESLLFDAKGMLDVMLERYKREGVTMYTPKGS